MANAWRRRWDNAKKIVEVELKAKGTPLHDATVVGDTVGDPFKDTSSVALNPIIKFTTLFGLLAVELAVSLTKSQGDTSLTHILAGIFIAISMFFVYRIASMGCGFKAPSNVSVDGNVSWGHAFRACPFCFRIASYVLFQSPPRLRPNKQN